MSAQTLDDEADSTTELTTALATPAAKTPTETCDRVSASTRSVSSVDKVSELDDVSGVVVGVTGVVGTTGTTGVREQLNLSVDKSYPESQISHKLVVA